MSKEPRTKSPSRCSSGRRGISEGTRPTEEVGIREKKEQNPFISPSSCCPLLVLLIRAAES